MAVAGELITDQANFLRVPKDFKSDTNVQIIVIEGSGRAPQIVGFYTW